MRIWTFLYAIDLLYNQMFVVFGADPTELYEKLKKNYDIDIPGKRT